MRTIVDGLDVVIRDLTFAADRVRPDAADVVVAQAAELAGRMAAHTPTATGRTAGSVTSDPTATVDGTTVSAEAGHEWFVARFIDQGTARMAPRPIAEPAIAEQLPAFERAIGALHDSLW